MFTKRYYNYNFRILSAIIIAFFLLIDFCLTKYKQEILSCSLTENYCKVTRVNYFNNKEIENLTKPYEITDIIVIKKIKRRHKNHSTYTYNVYQVAFLDISNNRIQIFKTDYKDNTKAQEMSKKLKEELLSHKEKIIIKRK